jgi:hypothetical protein
MVYLPPHFTETDETVLLAHIERYDFGLLITQRDGLIASQVPFLAERRDGKTLSPRAPRPPQPAMRRARRRRGAGDLHRAARLYLAELVRHRPGGADLELTPACTLTAWRERSPTRIGSTICCAACPSGTRHASQRRGECRISPRRSWTGCWEASSGSKIAVSRLEGKFKLSQNRPATDRAAHRRRARSARRR